MPGENILIIAVDGLRAASLGAYGNTSFSTPALDHLAAESFLFDFCFADAVELSRVYESIWQARLPKLLAERGYATTLITDEPAQASFPATADFGDLVQLTESAPTRADDISQTSLARIFTTTCDAIEAAGAQQMIWLHARAMYGAWDAPLDFQEPLLALEEGDPPPSDALEPPDLVLGATHDSDTAFRASCGYAAQVMVLDACLEAVRDTIAESKQNWLIVLLGTRGFPLGEHGCVGGVDGRLYTEQLHVPFLWRYADGTDRLARTAALTSHADFLPMLTEWLDGKTIGQPAHESIIATNSDGTVAIRTAEWTLRCPKVATARDAADYESEHEDCELFVRPDDRWEANNVAGLCPEVVEDLRRRLDASVASTVVAADSR